MKFKFLLFVLVFIINFSVNSQTNCDELIDEHLKEIIKEHKDFVSIPNLPENKNRTGITTVGATGLLILSGVIFADMSPWWLVLSIMLIISAIGLESAERK